MPYQAMIVTPDEFRRLVAGEQVTLEGDSLAGDIHPTRTALVLESFGGKDNATLTGQYAICDVLDAKIHRPVPSAAPFRWTITLAAALGTGHVEDGLRRPATASPPAG